MSPDYRHTDKYVGLVMVMIALNLRVIVFCCTRPPILTAMHQTFELDTWPLQWPQSKVCDNKINSNVKTQFSEFDLDLWLWPTIPAYRRSRSTPWLKHDSARRGFTNGWMDKGTLSICYLPIIYYLCYLSYAVDNYQFNNISNYFNDQ